MSHSLDPSRSPSAFGRRLLQLAALAAIAAVTARLAWLGDDAYITLRSVENWVRGDGMRWNVADRVQTYTHPLWMLTLSLGRWLSGEVYYTTLGVSAVLTLAGAGWLLLRARTGPAVAATAALLLCSRAFCDYTTSGLETPLTLVLLVGFVANALSDAAPTRRYTRAVLLANLLALNRMDLALLCLPAVLAAMRGVPLRAVVTRGALMSLPFAAWLAFAGLYYGSPFPVTAHAKAFGVGIDPRELAEQGLRYLRHTAKTDPVTFAVATVGALAVTVPRRSRWLGLGALCYLAYVVKVGGGFMQGRFFLPPFVVAVACLGPWLGRLSARGAAAAALAALAALGATGWPAWATRPASDTRLEESTIFDQHGIIDERRMYYFELGMLSPTRALPTFGQLEQFAFPGGREEPWWLLNSAVGEVGFNAGAAGHVVDPMLCDPLVARLPARNPNNWRIGHVLRRIPEGYWESLRDDANRIYHPGLRRYYEALRLLTRAPVFRGDRLAALWDMARGAHDAGFRQFLDEHYHTPPRVPIDARALRAPLEDGAFWFDEPAVHVVYEGGVAIEFGRAVDAARLDVQVLGVGSFRARFLRDGEVVGEAPLPPPPPTIALRAIAGLRSSRVAVPAGASPFDTLWIDFVEGPWTKTAIGPPGVGSVRVVDE
ncbi:MAG: hypothetical protein ACON4Z_11275 [Planctomycetota bacterium]